MNVDEAMEIATSTAITLSKLEMAEVSEVLSAEVERLRAEVQRLDIAGTHSCHDDYQRLPCAQRREIERLRAELAEAKAASVVPVKVLGIYDSEHSMYCRVVLRCKDDRTRFQAWLRDRMKDTTPPQPKPSGDFTGNS